MIKPRKAVMTTVLKINLLNFPGLYSLTGFLNKKSKEIIKDKGKKAKAGNDSMIKGKKGKKEEESESTEYDNTGEETEDAEDTKG